MNSLGSQTEAFDGQYIQDPAINPAESPIGMFNLRGRVAL